jgi:preprotein translocase subunit SecG
MVPVLLTVHILACIAMIGVILLQRSEGGGLGLGTGGGVGGLMTGRGAANALTRTTVIFAAIFISTSIALAILAKERENPLAPTGGPAPMTPLGPATGSELLPATPPTGEQPAGPTQPANPSEIPVPAVPAAPAPTTPAPAQPTGAQPAPAPAEPSGGGN